MNALAIFLALSLGAQAPGYEAFTKRELWETAERFRSKQDVALKMLDGCEEKLSVRTATVINHLVVAQPALEKSEPGHSTELVAFGVLAGIVFGGILGVLIAKDSPQTVVVR